VSKFKDVLGRIPEEPEEKKRSLRSDPTKKSVTIFLDAKKYEEARYRLRTSPKSKSGIRYFSELIDSLLDKWLAEQENPD
jgi:hypothetical protein